jgi:hypothetical protein
MANIKPLQTKEEFIETNKIFEKNEKTYNEIYIPLQISITNNDYNTFAKLYKIAYN